MSNIINKIVFWLVIGTTVLTVALMVDWMRAPVGSKGVAFNWALKMLSKNKLGRIGG